MAVSRVLMALCPAGAWSTAPLNRPRRGGQFHDRVSSANRVLGMEATDLIDAHRARVEELAEDLLRPYLKNIAGHSAPGAKEFNDPIWGTLYLRPSEVLILDSPLLQRLRRIRQLGVVHLVYPAATHTRLEHSLGVVHQVQRMVTSLNDRGFEGDDGRQGERHPVIGEELETTLRMAALCHDIGHGFMSHVSEYALDRDRRCRDLQLQFQNYIRRPSESQLSEMAAYFLVASPAFRELLDRAFAASRSTTPNGLVERMQALILGMPVGGETLLLHEFISGPFDADKLDYLARDSTMCGVPNVTDIPRLIQKLRATRIDRERLPQRLKSACNDRPAGYVITGISTSGGRTLDEIALARTLLFDKVYRHQKVRAIEYMVFGIVQLLSELTESHPSVLPFALSDDELLSLDHATVTRVIGRSIDEADRAKVSTILDLSQRLRDRRLFSRGFAFASVMTGDDYRHDAAQGEGLQRFLRACGEPDHADQFIKTVSDMVVEIASVVDTAIPVPADSLPWYLRLSPPKQPPRIRSSETGHAQLIESDGTITQVSEDAAETTPWTDAYVATRDLGHIFCPAGIAPLVFVAAETALFEEFGVRIPPSMLHYAKQDPSKIDALRRKLEQRGWYVGRSRELRPVPRVLLKADYIDRIDAVVQRLGGYSGPEMAGRAGQTIGPSGRVGRAQVTAFVQQFSDGGNDLVDAALTVLSSVKVLGRREVSQAVRDFIAQNPKFRGASCAPLGSGKDSSAVLTYFVGDVATEFDLTIRSVEEALAHEEPILFVDDFVGTGRQSVDIFEAWLTAERTGDLDEERSPLPAGIRGALQERSVGLVFTAGTEEGVDMVRAALARLGVQADVFAGMRGEDMPTVHSCLEGEQRDSFLEFARTRGFGLLEKLNGKPRSNCWRRERSLGYGNRGLLLVSAFNTPTATLTLLWASGTDWTPLLPRRTKM